MILIVSYTGQHPDHVRGDTPIITISARREQLHHA